MKYTESETYKNAKSETNAKQKNEKLMQHRNQNTYIMLHKVFGFLICD